MNLHAHDKMEWIYASTKAIHRRSVELYSHTDEERKKKVERKKKIQFYHHLVQDVDEGIYMHTGRDSYVHSDGEST